MKVYIGPYVEWIGPYQIAAKLMFWVHPYESEIWDTRVHKFGEFLAHGFHKKNQNYSRRLRDDRPKTWLYKLCEWIHEKKKRKVKIHIDDYDVWSMDATLSLLVLPMLKKLKENKHGSGYVDLEDVPEHLRFTETEDYDAQDCFEFYHAKDVVKKDCNIHTRYEWLLDELIWTFEQLQPDYDWEDQYRSGEIDFEFEPCREDADGKIIAYQMVDGPNHTYKVDREKRDAHEARVNNGLRLMGKYWRNLWD